MLVHTALGLCSHLSLVVCMKGGACMEPRLPPHRIIAGLTVMGLVRVDGCFC